MKFILHIINKELNINNKKKSKIESKLEQYDFPQRDKSYNYLLGMSLYSLTYEKVEELRKQKETKETEYTELKNLTKEEIWYNELEELEQEYITWRENRDE